MKTVIRRSVFETNSSSTHSLTYSDKEPKEYSFECDSPWSRLLMLKALINVGGYRDLVDEEDIEPDNFDLDELEENEQDAANMSGDDNINEAADDDNEDEEKDAEDKGPTDSDYIKKFYDVCLDVFCENEKVEKENIAEYLALKRLGDIESKHRKQFIKRFILDYDNYGSEELCESMFSEGCLDFCTCGYDFHYMLLFDIFDRMDYRDESIYPEVANNYLYGKKRFFGIERYCGCMLMDDKDKI